MGIRKIPDPQEAPVRRPLLRPGLVRSKLRATAGHAQDGADGGQHEPRNVEEIGAALHATKLVVVESPVVVLHAVVILLHVDVHGIPRYVSDRGGRPSLSCFMMSKSSVI